MIMARQGYTTSISTNGSQLFRYWLTILWCADILLNLLRNYLNIGLGVDDYSEAGRHYLTRERGPQPFQKLEPKDPITCYIHVTSLPTSCCRLWDQSTQRSILHRLIAKQNAFTRWRASETVAWNVGSIAAVSTILVPRPTLGGTTGTPNRKDTLAEV